MKKNQKLRPFPNRMSCINGTTAINKSSGSKPVRMTALACSAVLLSLSAAQAIGPDYQIVPNPAPGGANTLSSVVGVIGVGGGTINNSGTGTVIDSYVNPSDNTAYLCVLTADHVVVGGVNMISFPNYTFGAAPPAAGTYPI